MKKFLKLNFVVLFITASMITSSCNKESGVTHPTTPVNIDLTASQLSMVAFENNFAFDLFKKLVADNSESGNVIFSPLSISDALSMTLNGANGATRDSILTALRMSGVSVETINSSYKDLINALLNVDDRVQINIANSLWARDDFSYKQSFSDILKKYYNADTKSFSLSDPSAITNINKWIENNTNGLIKNMLDNLDDKTVMLLINAIYFKGKWKSQFDKSNTSDVLFYKTGGTTVKVPMMKQTAVFKAYKGDSFTMGEFPYGQGNYVMDVILPDNNNGLNDIISQINSSSLNNWINRLSERTTDLSLPRFKYGYKKELKDIMSNMGMKVAFTDKADFSNLSDISLYISFILHQAFIENNEEGTEAAAATVIGMNMTSANPDNFMMNIDHPFVYIIREITTNSILFMGIVNDPSSE